MATRARILNRRHARLTWVSALLSLTLLGIPTPGSDGAFAATKKDAPASKADDDRMAKARAHVERGKRLGEVGRYGESIAEFEKAYLIAPIPEILLNIALSYRFLKDWDHSIEIYERYLRLKPDAKSRKEVEKILSELAKEKAAADKIKPPAGTGAAKLSISSDPPGAEVSRGGKKLGRTPLVLDTEPGDYVLHFELVGHEPKDLMGAIKPGGTAEVSVALAPIRTVIGSGPAAPTDGKLAVATRIAGIEVYVDGELVDHTPMEKLVTLPAGIHRVTVKAPGLAAPPRDVNISAGVLARADFALSPANPRSVELFTEKREKFLASGLTIDGFRKRRVSKSFIAWGVPLVAIGTGFVALFAAAVPGAGGTTAAVLLGVPPLTIGTALIISGAVNLARAKKMTWDRPKADRGDGGLSVPPADGVVVPTEVDSTPATPAKEWTDEPDGH